MVLSKKRKQQLKQMTAQSIETRKRQKIDGENRKQRDVLRRQREQEDLWDEYEDPRLESSSDESDCDESSLDEFSSDEDVVAEHNVIVGDNLVEGSRRGDSTFEGLGDGDGGVQLKNEERVFNPFWRPGADDYLRQTLGCGSKATENRRKKEKRKREELVLETRSLVDLFSAQHNADRSENTDRILSLRIVPESLAMRRVGRMETKTESRTRAVHDLGKLLRLQTEQTTKYGHVLAPKSNHCRCHHMVQSFLWMQINKGKNTLDLDRQGLARIVAQSFNKKAYTGRKIVEWERSWVKHRVIPNTKAGNNKSGLCWMEDEDLVLSVKDWIKKTGESKCPILILIIIINMELGITSYSLAQYVGEYLHKYRPELAPNEIDTQEKLEETILCGSTIRPDGIIDRRAGICSRIARRWLNNLGYKWKEVQKDIFFDGHEREDVIDY